MFISYLRSRKRVIGFFVLICVVSGMVFSLYRLPVAPVAYTAVICAFFGSIIIVLDFRKFLLLHKKLEGLIKSLERTSEDPEKGLVSEQLPAAQKPVEKDYQRIIQLLCEDRKLLTEQMEERYRDLVEYYTVWVHQIKTPIAAMGLILQGAEAEAETDVEREWQEPSAQSVCQRQELLEELKKIEQYVEMVLCYLRLDAGSTDYVIKEYALDDIIKQAIRGNASVFIRKKIRLVYEPSNVRVVTDEKWLLFVIGQILSNALKYTPGGNQGTIWITMEEPGTLCIRDNGIGIAAEDLPRIFEKGYTGANGRTDKKASGIGMYLSRRICENLGHRISVTSRVGKGTGVCLDLKNAELEIE